MSNHQPYASPPRTSEMLSPFRTYRDMSGESLHRRGYRDAAIHRAALNESAAAGVLSIAGKSFTQYFVPCTLYTAPSTLYPVPSTLYPIPYTLYPIPYTLYPIPYTLYPESWTLRPEPYTLNPEP